MEDAEHSTIVDDLRRQVTDGHVLFVVGAGVSILATNNAPVASWTGLLQNGLQRIRSLKRCNASTFARFQEQLGSEDLDELLGVATFVATKLGQPHDGEFRSWLRETVGSLRADNPAAIASLVAIGCPILTTNYDSLIDQVAGLPPATWNDPDRWELVLRGTEQAILHFHGFWQSPESIVLGQDTYARITADERAQTWIRAAHLDKTFVYVGFGDGLRDPNFAKFFQWCETLFGNSQPRRYRLARRGEVSALQSHHTRNQRVQVISYGEDYYDLAAFLTSLSQGGRTKPAAAAAPSRRALIANRAPNSRFELRGIDWYEEDDAAYLHGRAADIDAIKRLLVANPIIRLTAPSGTGKSSLLRAGVVPALRQLGWRAVVIRPYENPGELLVDELTRTLLDAESPPFTGPLEYHHLRQQIAPLLIAEGTACVVFLIDQVEDVIVPTASADARSRLRSFLRDISRCADLAPLFRAVISYRTDADAQLGRIWQEASGSASGFPYHTLLGITVEDAEAVIVDVARRLEWTLEISPRDLAQELRAESRSSVQEAYVFPPYLQILLSTIAAGATKTVDSTAIQQLGGVRGILGTYLRRVVDQLEARGGDYCRVRDVLQAVCRSSGEKLRQSVSEIADDARLPEHTTRILLGELVRQRLVRPLGGDAYEIQHDRLAEAIVGELGPAEKEAMQANELLRSKSASFRSTRAFLTEGEVELLFRHRNRVVVRGDAARVLVPSVLNLYLYAEHPPVGWTWLRGQSLPDTIRLLEHAGYSLRPLVRKSLNQALASTGSIPLDLLVRIADSNVCNLRNGALQAIVDAPLSESSTLRALLRHDNAHVRRAAAVALGRRDDKADRKALREAAETDSDSSVRRAATDALGRPRNAAEIAMLRNVAATRRGEQPKRAVELLALCATPVASRALRHLVDHAETGPSRTMAAAALLRTPAGRHLERQLASRDDWRLKVALAQQSSSERTLATLAMQRAKSVRIAALERLSSLRSDSAYKHLIGALVQGVEPVGAVLSAIARSGNPAAHEFLRNLAETTPELSEPALAAIAKEGTAEAVTYLLTQAARWEAPADAPEDKPPQNPLHRYAAAAVRNISDADLLPELRGWAESGISGVAIAAIESFARLSEIRERIWMLTALATAPQYLRTALLEAVDGLVLYDASPIRDMLNTDDSLDHWGRVALQSFIDGQKDLRSLPALRELSQPGSPLRARALLAIARFGMDADLELFLSTARAEGDDNRGTAVIGLGYFRHEQSAALLKQLILSDDAEAIHAAWSFARCASRPAMVDVVEQLVAKGDFDFAGIVDFALNRPRWWPWSDDPRASSEGAQTDGVDDLEAEVVTDDPPESD